MCLGFFVGRGTNYHMQIIQVTAATTTPVSLTQVKQHLGISSNYDDARLMSYLEAAISLVENETNLCLCPQTWTEVYALFPHGKPIETRRAPIASITSLTYYDETNTQQTLVEGTDYYALLPYKAPAVLTPIGTGADLWIDWPTEYRYRPDCVQLTYSAGWSTSDNVWLGPPLAQHAIKLLVEWMNSGNRGSNDLEIPDSLSRVMAPLCYGFYR